MNVKQEKKYTRRALIAGLARSAMEVAVAPAIVLVAGPRVFPPILEKLGRLFPPLSGDLAPTGDLPEPVQGYAASDRRWGFGVDTRACIGCGRCVRACKLENHVPMVNAAFRTWVERYRVDENRHVSVDSPEGGIHGFPPQEDEPAGAAPVAVSRSFFVPKLCNQCERSPCSQVCPVGATFWSAEGLVLVDRSRCIGCGYCVQTCPYGARFKHPTLHVADKCTWCYHRIVRKRLPACVEVCPRHARIFGELDNPDSDIRVFLRQKDVYVLKEEMGTLPKCYYTGYRLGVV